MEWLIIFVMLVGIMAYTKRGKEKKPKSNSPSGYKMRVKKLLRESSEEKGDPQHGEAVFQTLYKMADEPGIQEFFRKTYGGMCPFSPDEKVLESFFLLVFGDMRTHHIYRMDSETGKFIPDYEDFYKGDKNYNMIITDRCLYFGDDLEQKKGRKAIQIPLHKVEQVERTQDYVEITVKTRLSGTRVHNVWCSSGNEVLYRLLSYLLDYWENIDGQEPVWASKNGRNILK
jgi:hypothetical protein